MKTCVECKRRFPSHLLSEMAIGGAGGLMYKLVCPMCALKIEQRIHGIGRQNFTPGSLAQQMLEESRRFVSQQPQHKE